MNISQNNGSGPKMINPDTFQYPHKRPYTQEELDRDILNRPVGKQMYEKVIVSLAFIFMISYMVARWYYMFTLESTYYVSIPLLIVETSLVVPGMFISYFCIWNKRERPRKQLSKMEKIKKFEYPTVDIFIPCLNEPVDIIRATVQAALNINYPKKHLTVIICDDGKRNEVKAIVDDSRLKDPNCQLGAHVRYVARTKTPGVPHHAKAGNLNHAIFEAGTYGQLFAVLDCDMLAKPEYLEALVPHFYKKQDDDSYVIDDNLAFCQSPQAFYNIPEGDLLGQQYRFFYGPGNLGWDGADCAPCCGTNNLFSRKAMTAIGGFTYGSITEDFLTSMTLHNNGYQSKYIHEYLAYGLAPDTLSDFMKQRNRWAAGAVEIFVYNNSLFKSGLSIKQKYLYFWAGLQAYLAFPLVLIVMVPFIAIAYPPHFPPFILSPMPEDLWVFLMFNFLFWNIWMLFVSYDHVPKSYLARSVQESVFMIFTKFYAFSQVHIKGHLTFKVTNKSAAQNDSIFWKEFKEIRPFVIYYTLSMLAIAKVIYENIFDHLTGGNVFDDTVALVWMFIVMWQCYPPIKFFLTTQVFVKSRDTLKDEESN